MLLEDPLAGFERRPRDGHARAADAPPEQDAHAEAAAAAKPDRLQRHAHLDGVTRLVQPSGAVPDEVGRLVLAAGGAVQHVELHAARVHHQMVRSLPRAERVEAEADPIIRPDVVAARDRRLDPGGLRIVALEREIEVVGVVPDPDFGLLRDRVSMKRVVRQPLAGLERPAPPRVIVQDAVDDGRLRGTLRSKLGSSGRGLSRHIRRGLRTRLGRNGDAGRKHHSRDKRPPHGGLDEHWC